MTESFNEASGDFDLSDAPYSTPFDYAAADVTDVNYGFDGDYFYVARRPRRDHPDRAVRRRAAGEVEAQTITDQAFSIVMDTDNNDLTGAGQATRAGITGVAGADILFGFALGYGGLPEIFATGTSPAATSASRPARSSVSWATAARAMTSSCCATPSARSRPSFSPPAA